MTVRRFRKKPVEIEAVQFVGDVPAMQRFTHRANFTDVAPEDRDNDPEIVAEVWDHLHATWVGVKVGQWIIKGIQGEFYPCDPDVFEASYEPVSA